MAPSTMFLIEALALVGDALEDWSEPGGLSEDESIELLAAILDAALPLNALIPGELGEAAERADGPALEQLLKAIAIAFRRDPRRMRERADRIAARGNETRATRIRARADRLAHRRGSGFQR